MNDQTLQKADREFKIKQRILKEIEETDLSVITSQWTPFNLIAKWQKALKEFEEK